MKLRFRVLNTSLKGLQYETDQKCVEIGRSSENDLVLQEKSVSRHHATIVDRDSSILLKDAGSRNQTQLDGEIIDGPTPLHDGCILSFGDVAVQVLIPSDEPQEDPQDEEPTPEGGTLTLSEEPDQPTVQGGGNPSSATATVPPGWMEQPGEEAEASVPARVQEDELERKLWPFLVLVLGLAAGVVLVVFFLRTSGSLERPRREMGVAMRLGQRKVVQVPRGYVNPALVKPPGAVRVERALNLSIAVQIEARSQGLASVRLESDGGDFVVLHVNVLPRADKSVEEFFGESIETRAERIQQAREHMKRAEVWREQGDLYEAKEAYERAIQLMEPLSVNPPSELRQAETWREKLQEQIDERYDRLTFEMSNFMKDGDKRAALERLADIKQLIPDEEDIRWQNADLLYRLLERVISRESERRGL